MDIIDMIEDLNRKHKNKEIIEYIEKLEESDKTPQVISLLARAYNNIVPLDKNNKQNYKYALKLLDSVKEQLCEDANWNFRKAYAHYHLDQEGYAKIYFERALKKNPIDKDAKEFIYTCNKVLVAPCMEDNFRQRVKICWEEFENNENSIRKLLLEDENSERVKNYVESILNIAFTKVNFRVHYIDNRFQLKLIPDRKKLILLQLLYFKARATEKVLENWDIIIGRQRIKSGYYLNVYNDEIGYEDVFYNLKNVNISGFDIEIFCEKLKYLILKDKKEAIHCIKKLLDNAIGEISSIGYVSNIEFVNKKDEHFKTLDKLYENMKHLNMNLDINNELICENVVLYDMDPIKDANIREDITVGVCFSTQLLKEYKNSKTGIMDYFQADGVVPGFLAYPIEKVSVQEYSAKVLDLREEIKQIIQGSIGKDAITFVGEASGINMGYIDFIAWDLGLVIYGIKKMFDYINIEYVVFKTFRKDVDHILIKNKNSYSND